MPKLHFPGAIRHWLLLTLLVTALAQGLELSHIHTDANQALDCSICQQLAENDAATGHSALKAPVVTAASAVVAHLQAPSSIATAAYHSRAPPVLP